MSILSALGLSELEASSSEQYVDIELALASDLQRLESFRAGLRDDFEKSPLRDEKKFATHFENLPQPGGRNHLAESKRL
jgi:predicted O-linked N-acetylglucosamine transferase (SPINDLY family)